jgi:hypothetical protein
MTFFLPIKALSSSLIYVSIEMLSNKVVLETNHRIGMGITENFQWKDEEIEVDWDLTIDIQQAPNLIR